MIAFATDATRAGADEVIAGSGPVQWNLAMRRLRTEWKVLDAIHIHGGIWRSQIYYYVLRAKTRSTAWVVHLHGSEARQGKGLHHLRLADAVLASTPDLVHYVPGSLWLPNPVQIPPSFSTPSSRGRVTFSHFPTDRRIKGTESILSAFREAFGGPKESPTPGTREERWTWDEAALVIGEHLPQGRVFELMEESDAVIDHLSELGPVSLVALEGMARGRAALSSFDRDRYPEDCPVIRITLEDAASVLRRVVRDRHELEGAGVAGRGYVERRHHPDVVVARTIDIYDRSRRARSSG